MNIVSKAFGKTKSDEDVTAFTLTNHSGSKATILDFGATIQSLFVPDKNGNMVDVILGYDDISYYEIGGCFYGAIVGRYANRIKDCLFPLDGKMVQLEKNSSEPNHVHGVFSKRMFKVSIEKDCLCLSYLSPDGEEGFSGNLRLEVRYVLTEDNAIEISYKATTDAPTAINLTNHAYFNLNGQDGSTVFDHIVMLNSDAYTEYEDTFAQTGRIIPVEGTPLDFRKAHAIGETINEDYYQLRLCAGYDHNMIINGTPGTLRFIGKALSPKTGICLEAFTTEPAIQFYTSNYVHFDPAPTGKNGIRYPKQGGLCMEAQHYPDSVNHPHFPSTILRPGETYIQKTIYRLSILKE